MPRTKTPSFVIDEERFDENIAPGKRKRSDGEDPRGFKVFGIRFRDDWCIRYRPAWKNAAASLMVYEPLESEEDRVWECVHLKEHRDTVLLNENGRNASTPRCFLEQVEDLHDVAIGAGSLWGALTASDAKLTGMFIDDFEQDEEDRAAMDISAIVLVQARGDTPECRLYYTMRLELVRIVN